ncbi:MAG: T9SS type A sorting domain-containing protein [Bradyrhizobiaceae bacterium]|nr:T9SS type A sorting domain-containing protein [Bradyrhizobiaceae bacterium]
MFSCPRSSAQQIVGSDRHASILCANGAVFSWGENRDGQLGDGTLVSPTTAVKTIVSRVARLSVHGRGAVAVDDEGKVFAWGTVAQKNYGVPSWGWVETIPRQIPFASDVRLATWNDFNIYYLLTDMTLYASGANTKGQYGNGTTERQDTGSVKVLVDSVIDVFCARATAFAARIDGAILAWGSNQENQIDTTSKKYYTMPQVILRTPGIVSTCGTSGGNTNNSGSMRVVTVDGDVYVWGDNDKNQLGVSGQPRVALPTKLMLHRKVIAVSGGIDHTIVLLDDGSVWTWGDNFYGQLGNPSPTNTVEPTPAVGLSNIVAIGAGEYSSYAITRDGELYGWGDNTYRQLNLDTTPIQYTPVQLPVPCNLATGIRQNTPLPVSTCMPNPVLDVFTVTVATGTTRVDVFSTHGKLVRSLQVTSTESDISIDIASEPPGVYAIVQSSGSRVFSTTLVKL